jgi:hypothetical protein
MDEQITNMRIATLEARMAALEQRLANLEQGGGSTSGKQKKRKDLSPEQRAAIRARLVAGQERKRQEREAASQAEAKKPAKK